MFACHTWWLLSSSFVCGVCTVSVPATRLPNPTALESSLHLCELASSASTSSDAAAAAAAGVIEGVRFRCRPSAFSPKSVVPPVRGRILVSAFDCPVSAAEATPVGAAAVGAVGFAASRRDCDGCVLLVRRGSCSFEAKARLGFSLGAVAVLVADNEASNDLLIMAGDGGTNSRGARTAAAAATATAPLPPTVSIILNVSNWIRARVSDAQEGASLDVTVGYAAGWEVREELHLWGQRWDRLAFGGGDVRDRAHVAALSGYGAALARAGDHRGADGFLQEGMRRILLYRHDDGRAVQRASGLLVLGYKGR